VVHLDEPKLVEPDLEVVMLTHGTEHHRIAVGKGIVVQRYLVRGTGGGYRLAGVGPVLPVPGWPPSEVPVV